MFPRHHVITQSTPSVLLFEAIGGNCFAAPNSNYESSIVNHKVSMTNTKRNSGSISLMPQQKGNICTKGFTTFIFVKWKNLKLGWTEGHVFSWIINLYSVSVIIPQFILTCAVVNRLWSSADMSTENKHDVECLELASIIAPGGDLGERCLIFNWLAVISTTPTTIVLITDVLPL